MFYLGIDIAKNTHVASLMDENGKLNSQITTIPRVGLSFLYYTINLSNNQ